MAQKSRLLRVVVLTSLSLGHGGGMASGAMREQQETYPGIHNTLYCPGIADSVWVLVWGH